MESLAVFSYLFIVITSLGCLLSPLFAQLFASTEQMANSAVVDEHDLSIEQLGELPMYGDTSDQGAVDVAIKIRDLQLFQQQAKSSSEISYYRQQIQQQCDLLVDLTLIQIAPLDIPEHELFIPPNGANLVYLSSVKQVKEPL